MAADGQVVFEISADGKKAYAAINDVTEALKKAGKDWESEAKASGENMTSAFAKALDINRLKDWGLKAGKALLDFGKDALQAASDLAEVQNVVNVTFGDGAAQIEAWASSASTAFGLTELQAKRYTSTMGAMLKSSGLAGDQIIEMSTDLAGLAADMASFYNLDFDTAFQKIRSGISGITMPLKELGINLSVDTLNAFALSQGLDKTYAQMNQAEQTMIRYQYLMQATADAQGDFSRTSDELANAQRRVESAITNIKAALGQTFYDTMASATDTLAGFLESLVPDKSKRTVLDEIADIDIQKETKLAQIQAVAQQANDLLGVLETINTNSGLKTDSDVIKYINTLTGDIGKLDTALTDGDDIPTNLSDLADGLDPTVTGDLAGTLDGITGSIGALDQGAESAGDIKTNIGDIAGALDTLPNDSTKANALSGIAGSANELGILAGTKWQSFADALGDIGADTGGNLQGVAKALSTDLGGDADKWENLLKAIGGNAKAAIDAIGDNDGSKTKAFLANVAESADDLTTDYSGYWSKLLGVLGNNAESAIAALDGGENAGTALESIASGANDLGALTGAKWQTFAAALGSITDGAPQNLQGIANALQTKLGGDASKWENLLKAIGDNADDALAAIGDNDGATTKAFLENVAAGADDLKTDYAPYWTSLLSALGDNAKDAITALSGGDNAGAALTDIASGANDLKGTAANRWGGFITALGGLTGKADVPRNLNGVANALAKNVGGKASDWETLLQAVGDNLGTVTDEVVKDKGQTAAFLEAAAAAADDLGADYSALWAKLLVTLGTNAPAAVDALKDATNVGDNLGSIADGANKLKVGQSIVWTAMYNALSKIDSLNNIFTTSGADNVSALATALSTEAPAEDKAAAWETFLNALGSNAGALNALTGKDAVGAKEWLSAVSEALDNAKVDPDNVQAWSNLLGVFAGGLSKDVKGDFTNEIVTQLLAMGSQSEYARNALASLGYGTDEIDDLQKHWLETCQGLVKTIPGLSSIINTETGEIKGGTQAVRDYIKVWQDGQTKLAFMNASAQSKAAIEAKFAQLPGLELDARVAEKRARDYMDTYLKTLKEYGISSSTFAGVKATKGDIYTAVRQKGSPKNKGLDDAGVEVILHYLQLRDAAAAARGEVTKQTEAYNEAIAAWKEGEKVIAEMPDELGLAAQSTEELAKSQSTLAKAANEDADALAEVEAAVKQANDAMQALADYQEKIHNETASSVNGLISGFNEVISPMTKARNELKSWTAELGKTSTTKERREELEKLIEAANKTENAGPSFQSMQKALDSQLEFMQNYSKELAAARANGISDDILATLSDGSEASYDYLYALNHTLEGLSDEERIRRISQLNDTYAQVQTTAAEFTNTLTDQKLTADEEFKSLVEDVQEAVDGLNMGETTYEYMSNTLQGIISACGDKSEAIKTAVDGIVAQMQRLAGLGYGAYLTGAGRIWSISKSIWSVLSPDWGSNANGLDYVPYDGYLALLHQGERIQTAAEADLARRYSYQQPAFDYDAMGGAIGANIGRGNVYLDGQSVGRVISDRQANSYRALERSGWQG